MIGEYIRQGKAGQFSFAMDPGEGPQQRIVLRTRACPKSPVLELTLIYENMDVRRNVALYRIEKEIQVDPPPAKPYEPHWPLK